MPVAQPNIRFTTTRDGVDIGFWEIGSGPTLLLAQNRSLSHAELEWAVPSMAALYLELARYFRLVRFDPRGAGISGDSTEEEVTLDGLAQDIEAVAKALAVGELMLVGAISLGPAAVMYAVSHPEMVTHLILCDTGPRLSDLPLDAYVKATDALVDLGVIPSLTGLFPSNPTDDLPALERLMRGSLYNRPRIKARDLRTFDVTDLLDQVLAPTLVLKSQDSLYTDLSQTRALISGIPKAEMRVVPGTMAPWLADRDSVMEAFVSFLTSGHHQPDVDQSDGFLTVVFTDLVSSTEVLSRKGDLEARRAFREIEDLVAELSAKCGGNLIKKLGDGSLITFKSTRRAIDFSLELQDRMALQPIQMRVGMAAGEPIQEEGDVHGAVVVQASRIADLSEAGDVMVSDSVRQLAVGKEFEFEPRGQVHLKGFEEAQRVWKATRSHERTHSTTP
ncbi:MAG: adenylate/guanylate cyclase domain-containing protein [Acidimicrobiia bacterium]